MGCYEYCRGWASVKYMGVVRSNIVRPSSRGGGDEFAANSQQTIFISPLDTSSSSCYYIIKFIK